VKPGKGKGKATVSKQVNIWEKEWFQPVLAVVVVVIVVAAGYTLVLS